MKITIAANDLAAAMTKVRAAVPGRTTLPILETFLLDARDGQLSLTASQVDLEAWAEVPCEVGEAGRVAISANCFGVIKALGKQTLTIIVPEQPDSRATVEGSRQRYEFGTLPAGDFPLMPEMETDAHFEIDAGTLTNAFHSCIGTVSTQTGREYLHGVCLSKQGANLSFVSTDFNRVTQYLCPVSVPDLARHTIPSKAVSAAVAMLAGYEGTVHIRVNKSSISIEAGSTRMVARLCGGDFGSYEDFIDRVGAFEPNFRAHRSELSDAINRIIALRAETKAPGITIKTNGSAIEMASDRRGRNEGTEHVDAEIMSPTEFDVSTTYISGLVSVWPECAVLNIAAPHKGEAIVIRSDAIPGLMQMVAPMKLPTGPARIENGEAQ